MIAVSMTFPARNATQNTIARGEHQAALFLRHFLGGVGEHGHGDHAPKLFIRSRTAVGVGGASVAGTITG